MVSQQFLQQYSPLTCHNFKNSVLATLSSHMELNTTHNCHGNLFGAVQNTDSKTELKKKTSNF